MEQEKQKQNWNINFSSMAIGFLLALCLALTLGAIGSAGDESAGPYRCSANSDMAVFVIDTRTGQTWQLSRSHNIDLGTPFDRKSLRTSITPMVD